MTVDLNLRESGLISPCRWTSRSEIYNPDSSLADLYDETAMPPELRKAHQDNDRAVMEAYGFSVRDMDERN